MNAGTHAAESFSGRAADAAARVGAIAVPAPAKLNLFLHVTGRRPDGYHTLQTLFQLLDQGDRLWFTPRSDTEFRRLTEVPGVAPEDDLILRAARALAARVAAQTPDNAIPFGVDISIEKRLPMGGGLGGGSSDAASTLVALNALWGDPLSREALAEIGLALGADVPVFVHARTAFADGVGEVLQPVDLPSSHFLVVHPGCEVSTAAIFTDPSLTRDTPRIRIADFSYASTRNDCEPVARNHFSAVREALDWLSARVPVARLTGTGACLFAPFPDAAAARAELLALERAQPAWHGFVAAGVNESPLLAVLPALGAAGRAYEEATTDTSSTGV